MSDSPYFFDLDPEGLQTLVQSLEMPRFRAGQLLKWVYEKNVTDPQQMTDLSQHDRQLIAEHIRFHAFQVVRHQVATDGTQKLLLELMDPQASSLKPQASSSASTECVMIPAENEEGRTRRTACLSSQIGCPVGCKFCASGIGGLETNLTAGQIVEQVWWLNQLPELKSHGLRISNVVFMGMGEPLSNFDNVTQAIRTLTAPWAFNISGRKITVSTVGLPAQIRRLAGIDIPLTLAISLHAPSDELRSELIPWAQHTTIEAICDAARFYFDRTGREITLEYILLRNVNDRPEHAEELAKVARRLRCNVNLIRYNEVKALPYSRPTSEDVLCFQKVLRDEGINAHIRASRGRDIAAACGQLRHEATAGVAKK